MRWPITEELGEASANWILSAKALDLGSATITAALPGVVVLVVPARVLGQRAGSRQRMGWELTSSRLERQAPCTLAVHFLANLK